MKTKLSTVFVTFAVIAVFLLLANGCSRNKTVALQPKPTVAAPDNKLPVEPKISEAVTDREKKKPEEDIRFVTIYFDFDKSDIRPDQRASAIGNAELMMKNKNVKIRIEGHCDERGTNEYNIALGDRRARSIEEFMREYGVEENRITLSSYGEERPVDNGHNEEAWAKNRRCEFVIVTGRVSINE